MRPITNYDLLCGENQVQLREMIVGQKQLCKAVDCAVRFLYIDTGEIQLAKKKSDKSTIVKSIPSSETGARTGCKTKSGKEYLITNNPIKEKFTLWLVVSGGYEKLSVADNPPDFDKVIDYKN